jgi:signal transduction histidine kinase
VVPLVIVDRLLADGTGADALIELTDRGLGGSTRRVLAVSDTGSDEANRAIASGAVDGILTKPWTDEALRAMVDRFVAECARELDPRVLERVPWLAGWRPFPDPGADPARAGTSTGAKPRSFLGDRDLTDDEVEQAMIAELERVLDHPQRWRLPAGSGILTEGESIDGIFVVLDGEVRLFREVEGREIVFHYLTAGRIIGLMALARSRPAVFSVEAETDVTVLPVTFERLDAALRDSPSFTAHFVSVLVRSLARRSVRSIEQQLQIREYATTRIKESERLAVVGHLAAGVAHELNNPLQGIVSYAHLLLERPTTDERQRSAIEKIVNQADRCRVIVRALLDFSRPSKPRKQSSDVNWMLNECIELLDGQAVFLNIEIDRNLDPDLPLVMADPSQMQQVFVNLIVNAAEAMDGTGHLTITTRQANGDVEIEFSDTGPGIAPEDVERVFDPFFSTKQAAHGTGLGLAISYGIVREHQGGITVVSEAGAGATFVIRLPITADRPWSDSSDLE